MREKSGPVGRVCSGHPIEKIECLWARHPIGGEGQGEKIHPSGGRHLVMGAALVAFRHPQCIRGMGGLLVYVRRGQWVDHGDVHKGELPAQLEAYRGVNQMLRGV